MFLLSLQTPLPFKPRHSLPSKNGFVYASTSVTAPKNSRRKKPPKQKKRQWLTALRRRFRRGEKPPVRIHGRAHAPREKSRLERRVGCHL
ncbi:hypothetical protein NC653_040453 [Populus alba x Populus x berolinensis]|uniref:Uncharacterized protein n=1 Tax=Populus alba x Populus x berolinensis TaxID=444605 RepID=A0AAD6L7R6_9ROSI|nr:hypothetical protein NC653_040453 [Populus alba x Populus x berolinensis]